MNTRHSNIRFLFEVEDQKSFLFSHIKIIRNTVKHQFIEKVHSVVFY